MGVYVNPGNKAFTRALNSEIYIDKTDLIDVVNSRIDTMNCYMCVSRSRRFGKSMAADMLTAYYSRGCDSAALFAERKVKKGEDFQKHLNRHHVIRLDIQKFLETKNDLESFIAEIEQRVTEELRKEFPECADIDPEERLKTVLERIFDQTGNGFIFIIDEWDCVFRLAKEQTEVQKSYLDFLRGLFKGQDYVELAYMTGILPIKKYGEHFALNIFDEYSMTDPAELAGFFGFTEEEVRELCVHRKLDFTEIRKWYDGYLLNGMHIYNPKSVVDAVRRGKIKSYWTGTETYEALKVYIDMNFDGMKEAVIEMLSGMHCKMDPSTSQNDMTTFRNRDDVLTLLVHLGYLAYDEAEGEAFIPNQEIAQEYIRAVKVGGWEGLMEALNRTESLLKSTWSLDAKAVAEEMDVIHSETASLLKYNDENSLTCTVLMAYYGAKAYYMNPIMELPSGKGLADVVYLPRRNVDKPALVVELKWNKSAEGALKQIKERQYADWIQNYTGEILLVGINYDAGSKVHECIIETYEKS
ncbi:MAG: AAA family ATPase [Lachnospiraceae bacterium]|nr:AAA family ATPase [Lachnospiraceae bacterium]